MAGKKKDKKGKKSDKKAQKKAKKAQKKALKAEKQLKPAAPQKAGTPMKAKPRRAAKKAVARASAPKARALQDRQQPETLRLRSAGPSFTVGDLETSLAFYRDALGFVPGQRWEENGQVLGVELLAGSVVFWLGQDDWKKGRDRVKGLGFRMYCATSQDIDALAARVRGAGGTVVDGPKDEEWGGRSFAVRDPDGFVISFASHL